MPDTELTVRLKAVADVQGAAQMSQSLKAVQQQAAQTSRSVQSMRAARSDMGFNRQDVARFASTLAGVDLGLGLAATAADHFRAAIGASVNAAAEAARINRTVAASYGSITPEINRFADALSSSAGVSRQAILESAVDARTLSQNYGLSTRQIETLIERTTDLAAANGLELTDAFHRVQSAMRGEAESAEALGLVLNADFLAERQRAQGIRQSFDTLTQAQKAQVTYVEFLRQSAQFAGAATDSLSDLDGATRQLAANQARLATTSGRALTPIARGATQAADLWVRAVERILQEGEKLGRDPVWGRAGQEAGRTFLRQLAGQIPVVGPFAGTAVGVQQALPQAPTPPTIDRNMLNAEERLRDVVGQQLINEQRRREALQGTGRAMSDAQRAAATLANTIAGLNRELATTQQLAQDIGSNAPTSLRAGLAAFGDLQRIEVGRRQLAETQRFLAERRRSLEQVANTAAAEQFGGPPGAGVEARAQALAQIGLLDQLEAAERDLMGLQDSQRSIQAARAQLEQREAIASLAVLGQRRGIEAELESMDREAVQRARDMAGLDREQTLRARELQALERQINDVLDERLRLQQESAHIGAELASLPSQFALEDAQERLQRARLVASDRSRSAGERSAARRQVRAETRALPSREIAALDAGRAVRDIERQQRITQLEGRQGQIPLEEQRIGLQDQIQKTQDVVDAIKEQYRLIDQNEGDRRIGLQDQLAGLQAIVDAIGDQRAVLEVVAGANTAAIQGQQDTIATIIEQAIARGFEAQGKAPITVPISIAVQMPDGSVLTAEQLIQANAQATLPPVIQLSGLRRG